MKQFKNKEELFSFLRTRFLEIIEQEDLDSEMIEIRAKTLSLHEAIGDTKRQDFPIITGKEVVIEADFRGTKGQAFTDAPSNYRGTLKEIKSLDFERDPQALGLFIATLNAVMSHLGLVDATIHCRNDGPELCAVDIAKRIDELHKPKRVLLVGYQPAMFQRLSERFELRVFDLNEMNIGTVHYGVTVENGATAATYEALNVWPDVVLVTGSTICNGTLIHFLDLKKPTYFFGMTIAGATPLLGINRLCFADCY